MTKKSADGGGESRPHALITGFFPPGFAPFTQSHLGVLDAGPDVITACAHLSSGAHQLLDELGAELLGDVEVGGTPLASIDDDVMTVRCALHVVVHERRVEVRSCSHERAERSTLCLL